VAGAREPRGTLEQIDQELQSRGVLLPALADIVDQVINVGYRTLATRLHPEHDGGDVRQMQALNAVDRLRQVARRIA
jgi:hypothetical protein